MTDRELIQGISIRDQVALKELVVRHQEMVIRTCYSLVHDMEDARDLAQEVFIEILHSAGTFRGKARLSSWIYRIAVNKSLNHLSRMGRRGIFSAFRFRDKPDVVNGNPSAMEPGQAGGDALLEQKEMKMMLHRAMDRLPVNQRIAFTLHNYEELSYKEIAEVMSISLSSVESLIHRARQNLRTLLDKYYHQ